METKLSRSDQIRSPSARKRYDLPLLVGTGRLLCAFAYPDLSHSLFVTTGEGLFWLFCSFFLSCLFVLFLVVTPLTEGRFVTHCAMR